MKLKIYLLVLFCSLSNIILAQPSNMSINQDVSGTYSNTSMASGGGAYRARFQENGSGTGSGVRNWQFNSDGYSNTWGARTASTLSSYNTVIAPNVSTASGNWANACSPGCYNAFGKLPATQANYYYTYNILKGSNYASQNIAILETSFNPVGISSVTQNPAGSNIFNTQNVTITINTAATPSAGENVFVRYSTNGYATSSIVQATFAGATGTAVIPAQSSGTVVSYYVFSSNVSSAALSSMVVANGESTYDLMTLNLNNNGGSNYGYSVIFNCNTTGSSMLTACNTINLNGYASNPVTTSGAYMATFMNAAGCDSVHTYNVTINYSTTGSSMLTACNTINLNGYASNPVTTSGAYMATFMNAAGCDSVHTYNVTINYSTTGSSMLTACNTINLNGYASNPVTTSGAYMATFMNAAGCDSVHTYNVTINYSTTGSSMLTACNTINLNGYASNPVTTSGAYMATFMNAAGCDSVHTYNVTINYSTTGSNMLTACNTINLNGYASNPVTTSGAYMATFMNAAGCDSVHTYDVTILPIVRDTFYESICADGLPYMWNTLTINSAGTYNDTLVAANSCDSIVTLVLIVNPQPNAVLNYTSTMNICSSSPITLNAVNSMANMPTYRWFKDETFIPDSINVTLVVSETGSYYVSIKDAFGCKDTSNHIQIFATGNTVLNTNNSGTGSLRRAIECAMPGDSIMIDFGLTGMIELIEPLLINKDLTIGNDAMTKTIRIDFSGIPSLYGIYIAPMTTVKLRNLNIIQANNIIPLPLIQTEGQLNIENVHSMNE